MTTVTRRELLRRAAVAGAGAATFAALTPETLAAHPERIAAFRERSEAPGATPTPLTEAFSRSDPALSVHYPGGWLASERIVDNLLYPLQLVTLSSRDVRQLVQPTDPESGIPDAWRLPTDAVLIVVYGEQPSGPEHAPTIDASKGVNLDTVVARNDGPVGFDWLFQWFERNGWIFTFTLWVGKDADPATARAVMESLTLG